MSRKRFYYTASYINVSRKKVFYQSIVIQLATIDLWSDSKKIFAFDAVNPSTSQCRGVNTKSCNVWIRCCDNISFAKIRTSRVLHLNIVWRVLEGFCVAIDQQKREYTVHSNVPIIGNLRECNVILLLSYIQ